MGLFDARDAADVMADLLDRERGAILAGRFDVLERLIPEKERVAGRLALAQMEQTVVDRLQQKAEHNGRLLDAMRIGLKDASARIAGMRRIPGDLHTYDAAGRRTIMGARPRARKIR